MGYREYIQIFFAKKHNSIILFLMFLFLFDAYACTAFFSIHSQREGVDVYFLDVGQGDAELLVFSEGARILIDGGPPNGKAIRNVERVGGFLEKFLDVAILTHPEEDHFGGLAEIFQRMPVSLLLTNDTKRDTPAFRDFNRIVDGSGAERGIVSSDDIIRYGGSFIEIVSPKREGSSGDVSTNDASIVAILNVEGVRILFSGDIGEKKERDIAEKIGSIDVLKVAHHGSKYSSSEEFLSMVSPKIAFIEVGKNSYGHPTEDVLRRLHSFGAKIFRTDIDHTLRLHISDGIGRVYSLD